MKKPRILRKSVTKTFLSTFFHSFFNDFFLVFGIFVENFSRLYLEEISLCFLSEFFERISRDFFNFWSFYFVAATKEEANEQNRTELPAAPLLTPKSFDFLLYKNYECSLNRTLFRTSWNIGGFFLVLKF